MKNVFYVHNICPIGGIETFLYNLVYTHPYPEWDITIYCQNCDAEQLYRLSKYCNVKFYKPGTKIICDTFWCNFNIEILDTQDVVAKNIHLILHGDYGLALKNKTNTFDRLPIHKRVNKYFGVSQRVCDSWKETTGLDAQLIYNPIVVASDAPLRLISAQRMTKEKGYHRMVAFADALDSAGIKYEWDVYTTGKVKDERFYLRKPMLNIASIIKKYDALVQLSSDEGYCYSAVESLCVGVPVIGTKLPVFYELGMNDTNSILIDFDMHDIPIERIQNIKNMEFEYKPKNSNWDEKLVKGKNEEEKIVVKKYRCKATNWCMNYRGGGILLPEAGGVPKEGQIFEVIDKRVENLLNSNYGFPLIEVIDEIKPLEEKSSVLTNEKSENEEKPVVEKKPRKKAKKD